MGSDGEALWDEIRVAGRCFVNNMYPSALSKASEILGKLRLNSLDNRRLLHDQGDQELSDVVEAAGMILVQSASEMGRLGSVFNLLEDHFENLELIPHYLVAPAITLQVSSQLHYPAELALQRYLDGWSREGHGGYTKFLGDCTMRLAENVYVDLSEVLSVQLLQHKGPKVVLEWIEKAGLPESRKKKIVEALTPSVAVKEIAGSSGGEKSWSTRKFDSLQPSSTRLSFGHWVKLFVEVVRVYWIQAIAGISLQSSVISKSVATTVVVYALIKERHLIRRVVLNVLEFCRTGLKDFWDLAFGLQINPLAAVTNTGR